MIAALGDPYTDYLDPDELEALRELNDGAYYGVGPAGGAERRGHRHHRASPRAARRRRPGIRAGDR